MGRKLAIVIGNTDYTDRRFSTLSTPAEDVNALARLLKDPSIGGFDVIETLINEEESMVSRTVEKFFSAKSREDLLLFYFSGHGMLDAGGELYLALKDTDFEAPRSSSLSAEFVRGAMDRTRSQRVVLILDCCHSGAFASGQKGVVGGSVGTIKAFEPESGFGRWVLTATDATQYAWEGNDLVGPENTTPRTSVFTRYLVQGLQEGAADLDHDGRVSVRDLNDYVYEQVTKQQLKQTPSLWTYKEQGNLFIANNPHNPQPALPRELLDAIQSSISNIRLGAVDELARLADSANQGIAQQARNALTRLIADDSRKVSKAAAKAMGTMTPSDRFLKDRFANLASPQDLPPAPDEWQDKVRKTFRRSRLSAKQSFQAAHSKIQQLLARTGSAIRERKTLVFRVEISLVALLVAVATWHFAPNYMGAAHPATQTASVTKPADNPTTVTPAPSTPAISNPAAIAQPPAATPSVVPQTVAPPAAPLQVSELVMKTYLIRSAKPTYPPAAQKAHMEGQVVLQALIDKDGSVQVVTPLNGRPILAAAAINAVQNWRYRPYPDETNPMPVATRITLKFELTPPTAPVSQYGILLSTNIAPYLGDTGLAPGTKIYTKHDAGVSAPQRISGTLPKYTKQALKTGLEGLVVVQILVRPDGTVGPVKLLRGLDTGLNQSAEKTVSTWRFNPGLKNGKPVPVWADVIINFVLPVSQS